MFGKGIYFADMSTKSANYCRTSPVNNTGILILCEAALGNTYDKLQAEYITKLPKGYQSTWGKGRTIPNPKQHKTLDEGKIKVPVGKPTSNPDLPRYASLLYNEFIVYDVSQVKIKYLLKCKFNYQKSSHYF
jgi:poly [ADP-ribose] polymerase